MEGVALGVFLAAAFIGGLVSGVAGFAMGVLLSAIWLHILPPIQTVTLVISYGLWTQGYAIWKLRRRLSWRKLVPFVLGGAVGVPIGAALLTFIPPAYLRTGIGVLLVLYSVYGLARPALGPLQVGVAADAGAGFVNGLLGGLVGLTGIVITVWCQWRGWPKDEQRTVFQPVNLAAVVMSAVALAVAGAVTAQTVKLHLLGLPFVLGGLWTGFRLYDKVDDAAFRKVILVLLFFAGLALVVPGRAAAGG